MQSRLFHRSTMLLGGVVLILGSVLGLALAPAWAQATSPDAVTAAWQRATSTGNYRFTSDLTQTTLPLATIANG